MIRAGGDRLLRGSIPALFLFVLCVWEIPARAEIETVRAEGFARGSGPQVRLDAQNDAIDEAIHLWVSSLVGEIPRDALTPLFELREKYATSSRLVRQHPEQGGLRVEAEVYLESEALRFDTARLIYPLLDYRPKVVVLVSERHPDEARPQIRLDGAVANEIRDAFTEQGFEVLDPETIDALYTPTELRGYAQGDAETMARLARELAVDVAVYGTASCAHDPSGDGRNMPRFIGSVELKAVGARQGYVCEWAKAEAALNAANAESGTAFALKDAAYKVRRHLLVAAILTAYTQERRPGILITVEDVPAGGWANHLRRTIADIPEVRHVEVLRAKAGTCRYEVELDGHIARVANELKAKSMNGMRLEIERAVPDALDFRLVRDTKVGPPGA